MVLAFVGGATNAGGFLAVGQYTSHMTGMVSSVADFLVLGQVGLALAALVSVLMFLLGAITTSMMVSWAQRRHLHGRYALPLLLEAALLLAFGVLGPQAQQHVLVVPATVAVLCFLMGLQNAVITKISNAVIRTTHLTGLITDLGIELGKLMYVNRTRTCELVQADHEKLWVQASLIGAFSVGAGFGAIGFKAVGFSVTIALAVLLLGVSWRPVVDDARIWRRLLQSRRARHGAPSRPASPPRVNTGGGAAPLS